MNKTILVIEKDEDLQELVSLILVNQGFTVKLIKPSPDALKTIQTVQPCAIILDIIQVTEEGTKLCRLIKETEGLQNIPIIVLSTHPKASTVKDVCADEVLSKPFDIDELVAAIEKQLMD
jgi:DNA-binding response OmpR family regulator